MRFGPFDLDLSARELRKHGVRLKLYDQPFEVLTMLVAQEGQKDYDARYLNGLITATPKCAKSFSLRVATVKP